MGLSSTNRKRTIACTAIITSVVVVVATILAFIAFNCCVQTGGSFRMDEGKLLTSVNFSAISDHALLPLLPSHWQRCPTFRRNGPTKIKKGANRRILNVHFLLLRLLNVETKKQKRSMQTVLSSAPLRKPSIVLLAPG